MNQGKPSLVEVPQLEDLGDVSGKSVLLRADFNVPIEGEKITDDLRIRFALPTMQWLIGRGAAVSACTHLGRPKGVSDPAFSVGPVRERLKQLAPKVTLLENLRFNAGEELNDPKFVAKLIEGHDFYVNDAFGASHRAHASIVGPPLHLPSAGGRLLHREVEALSRLRKGPRRPFVAVVGGAKVSDKLGIIEALLEIVDTLVVGGAMCFTFLAAKGHSVGDSLCEPNMIESCKELLENSKPIHLPTDFVAMESSGDLHDSKNSASPPLYDMPRTPGRLGELNDPKNLGRVRNFGAKLPEGWKGLDIGPGSAAEFCDLISDAGTVFWNGPMGVFEDERFAAGTKAIALAAASSSAFTVVGGGDSAAAAKLFGVEGDIDFISTGGGASLALIEQGDLVGLKALRGEPIE